MIFDKVCEYKNYLGISEKLDKALEIMASGELDTYELGRHDICDGLFVNVFKADTKECTAESKWEAHREYLDVHVVLEGAENISNLHLDEVTECVPYDATCDAVFFHSEKAANLCTIKRGWFMVCFPSDAHCPLLIADAPCTAKKAVFKVKVG